MSAIHLQIVLSERRTWVTWPECLICDDSSGRYNSYLCHGVWLDEFSKLVALSGLSFTCGFQLLVSQSAHVVEQNNLFSCFVVAGVLLGDGI